jgi:hypothetical protein
MPNGLPDTNYAAQEAAYKDDLQREASECRPLRIGCGGDHTDPNFTGRCDNCDWHVGRCFGCDKVEWIDQDDICEDCQGDE